MSAVDYKVITGPHTHTKTTVPSIMGHVLLALVPATAWGIYLYGLPAFNLLLITLATVVAAEAACLWVMKKPISVHLQDNSALVAGWLIAMTLPPWAPWWIAVVGGLFAIVIGKHVYGGIGQNVFNPAMLARVMLLVAFPLEMTTWIEPTPLFSPNSPGLLESLSITFLGIPDLDAVSSASIMGEVKTGLTVGQTVPQILEQTNYSYMQSFIGWQSGSLGETSTLLLALGGIYLLFKRIITWHIPVAMIVTTLVLGAFFNWLDPDRYVSGTFELVNGAMIISVFFIATDLVTSPSAPLGKIIFGAGCALIAFVIRTWGSFPEGIGFGVLLMNALTPMIDHYVRPRIYGRSMAGHPLDTPKPKRR